MNNVRHLIAVASGKGGVGKSTTAVNLALGLSQLGFKTGILDADIYGPSIAMMLGVKEGTKPEIENENSFKPIIAHGLQTMSMAYLTTEKTLMVWRGPMASSAFHQILMQTNWQNLDYLIIDMPPGTGDIQLTLAQKTQLTGAIIVTTPQDIALLDAKKGIEMFTKVNVPILGIIENMARHICQKCGHEEAIFGEHGGKQLAQDYQTSLLGSLPLDITIRLQMDEGTPPVIQQQNSPISKAYLEVAEQVYQRILQQSNEKGPSITFSED